MPSSYLFLNGLRFHYLHWNLDGTSRPVVLLHGLAGNARTWEPAAAYLAAAGIALLAPDLRGHGLTDGPDGDYGLTAQARDLAAFLDANDLTRPVLVGHSWGALIALDYTARFSFGPRAPAGIALVDGEIFNYGGDHAGREEARGRLPQPVQAGTPMLNFLEKFQDDGSGWMPPDEMIPLILASFEIAEDETLTPRLSVVNHTKILQAIQEFDPYEVLRKVRCPVLLVASGPNVGNPHSDPAGQELHERGLELEDLPAKELAIQWIPGPAHDLPLQKPQELAGLLLNFLNSLPA